ncbi:hypothetical protein CLAFUW4_06300 [Fulvia fulva]|uniref:Uncharacterized protein n=1 Tax=Passalora fulva TaxID=5499 RepID=A0A9Q8P9H6_PASFU|nr:uncharacterized protein CLAFUR5_06443 [Fulvia fulva]KAK4623670.1 hypothetical protein CLAFUR4_06303 [Fulvia fulva]KAK4625686.1 hypothetical protein CLAFUR0_06307 [Fulvia fulva]UJO18269.1 hypothetical protein CLAFUR5_06443 [Fulvia fulva]WPV14934.1 hypothetical protein CLAFUW4_06300 [Fulvia fulva]WPV29883.1 hypothetical protein CLAFUW7_06297 [Fulvia fulva]
MPSMEESKRQVKAGLSHHKNDVDHDAILASLQDEIDSHNARGSDDSAHYRSRHRSRKSDDHESSTKFRFKHGEELPKKRKHRSGDDRDRRRHRKSRKDTDTGPEQDETAAHPFPREPTNPEQHVWGDPNAAFRESLFDALADDEGAAYWESVYSQPIHVYPRPNVETPKGELEQMNDDDYAAFVQSKMWEKKNPHEVLEREQQAKARKEEEEERARRREEFIRRKERAAWERAQKAGARRFAGVDSDEDDYEWVPDTEGRTTGGSKRTEGGREQDEYRQAWTQYLAAWDRLKVELLNERDTSNRDESISKAPSKRIPWPVLQPKPVTKPNIEAFMRHVPSDGGGRIRLQNLKVERVRWHPDKVQQRFVGEVDEGTMKIVTGVFQVVDGMVEEERKRVSGA